MTARAQGASPGLSVPRDIERIVLSNGVRVWTERVPKSSSTGIGVWVDWASPYEQTSHSGAVHLLQRLALHGNSRETGEDIARAIASLGGRVSITTGRDNFGYFAEVPPSRFLAALGPI